MTPEQKTAGYKSRNRAHRKILNAAVIPTSLKLTILTIIAQLNGESGCRLAWPSAQFIADKLGLKKRMVQYHLKTIRELRIFNVRHLKPKEAIAYGKEKYGIDLKLNSSKRQAPPLYEVNGHDLWSNRTRLSKKSLEEIRKVMTSPGKVMQSVASISNATDYIQQKEKENAPLPSPFSSAFVTSFFSVENQGDAAGIPDHVYAVTTPETSSYCYAPANDGIHLPTHRHLTEMENHSGSERESHLIPQAGSGSRLLTSPLSESMTHGAEGGSPGSENYEPEERDYSSAIELESLEPEERDYCSSFSDYSEPEAREPAPVEYVSEARKGISELTEGVGDYSEPPLAQKKEKPKEKALSGVEILMRVSEEREARHRRTIPKNYFCPRHRRKWAPVGNAAPAKKFSGAPVGNALE